MTLGGLGAVVLVMALPFPRASAQETGGVTAAAVSAEETPQVTPEQLNAMKAEWEEVREQQIRMIREKEEQFEKLKEELFAKLRAAEDAAKVPVPEDLAAERQDLDRQKQAFAAERQKFFQEMNRQKERIFALQSQLDAREKTLRGENARFEQESSAASR